MKQRLIGAAVLVALAVIFLPMLLGRPSPSPDRGADVPMEIPAAPDRPLQTREIPLTLPGPATATSDAPPPPADPDAIVTVDTAAPVRVDALDPSLTSTTPASAPSPASTPAPTTAPPSVPTATPPASAAAPSTPAADAPTATEAPAAVPAGHRFAVNLGSYGHRANADALAAKLRASGLPVLGEAITLDGKPALRLRIGPYATRGEAEAARLKVVRQQADLPTSVVQLTDEQSPQARPAAAIAAGFAVQVGALRNETEATALRDRLRRGGFAAFTERAQTDDGVLWRVRAGPELTRARADTLRGEIRRKLALDGLVVSHP